MSDEIKEYLDTLKEIVGEGKSKGTYGISYWHWKEILDCITNLQQKVEQYENPDDLTLFYMWLDEKTKDKMKYLQQENEYLKMNNPEQNMEHFKIINENKRKINNLREQNIDLKQENERLNQLIKSLRGNIKDITKTSSNRKKAILDLMKKIEKLKKEIDFLKTSPFLFLSIEDDDLVRSYAFMKKELKDYKSKIDKAIEAINTQLKNAEGGYKDNLRIIKFNLIKGSCTFEDLKTEDDYKYSGGKDGRY